MRKKAGLILFLVTILVIGIVRIPVMAVAPAKNGTWGNVSWNLLDDGTLKITGQGEIKPWNSGLNADAPSWTDYTMGDQDLKVTSIVFDDGITKIGANTFVLCSDVTSIKLPSTLKEIEEGAFAYCESLENIVIPKSVVKIGASAFVEAHSLKNIYVDKDNVDIDETAFVLECEYQAENHVYKFRPYEESLETGKDDSDNDANTSDSGNSSNDSNSDANTSEGENSSNDANAQSGVGASNDSNTPDDENASDNETPHTHNYETVITPAGYNQRGSMEVVCSVCGDVMSTTDIGAVTTIELSKTSYTYSGKANKPKVTIKDEFGTTLGNDCYSVTYSNNKAVGVAKATITFKGNYRGVVEKNFTITPKTVSISALTSLSKGFTVSWKKGKDITGYEIQYSTNKKFTTKTSKKSIVSNKNTVKKKITKITGNKKYYVRVRTYKTVNGKKIYSEWSTAKNVKTKK